MHKTHAHKYMHKNACTYARTQYNTKHVGQKCMELMDNVPKCAITCASISCIAKKHRNM